MSALNGGAAEKLFTAIAELKTVDECRDFFEDLCTIKEILDMAQRFETAILLDRGKRYQEICENVGVSTATISRVNRCLNYGTGGYKNAISKVEKRTEKK